MGYCFFLNFCVSVFVGWSRDGYYFLWSQFSSRAGLVGEQGVQGCFCIVEFWQYQVRRGLDLRYWSQSCFWVVGGLKLCFKLWGSQCKRSSGSGFQRSVWFSVFLVFCFEVRFLNCCWQNLFGIVGLMFIFFFFVVCVYRIQFQLSFCFYCGYIFQMSWSFLFYFLSLEQSFFLLWVCLEFCWSRLEFKDGFLVQF